MKPYYMILLLLLPSLAMAQMEPFQSIKLKYHVAGNRIVRKPYDPDEMENKRSQEQQELSAYGDGITAYPNPAAHEVTVQLTEPDSHATTIIIYNTMGQRVASTIMLPGTSKAT